MASILPEHDLDTFSATRDELLEADVPEELANRIATLDPLYAGLDIVEVASSSGFEVKATARAYYQLGARLNIDWLHDQVEKLRAHGHWQAVARGSLREDLYTQQRQLTARIIEQRETRADIETRVDEWLSSHRATVEHTQRVIGDMRAGGGSDFATLTVALQEIRKLVEASALTS
jgi:glutamate dehydrogenase